MEMCETGDLRNKSGTKTSTSRLLWYDGNVHPTQADERPASAQAVSTANTFSFLCALHQNREPSRIFPAKNSTREVYFALPLHDRNKRPRTHPLGHRRQAAFQHGRRRVQARRPRPHLPLGYISDTFADLYEKLSSGTGEWECASPEDPDEYRAHNIFFVPESARWSGIQAKAKQPEIGRIIRATRWTPPERQNLSLRGVLPKIYADPELNK